MTSHSQQIHYPEHQSAAQVNYPMKENTFGILNNSASIPSDATLLESKITEQISIKSKVGI